MPDLKGYIRHLLDQKSGGMKLVELVSLVTAGYFTNQFADSIVSPATLVEDVSTALRNMYDVGVLPYGWRGQPKYFVYSVPAYEE